MSEKKQDNNDTEAFEVGASTAAGAAIGAVTGGPIGAIVGGAIGAVGGKIAHEVTKAIKGDNGEKKK